MISGLIFTSLRGLVNDHVYPNAFPQPSVDGPGSTLSALPSPPWPAIRFTMVGALNEGAVCGTTGMNDDDSDWQIDVVAKTFGAMQTLAEEVDAQMRALDPPAHRQSYFQTKDSATKTHRAILTYRVFASSTPIGDRDANITGVAATGGVGTVMASAALQSASLQRPRNEPVLVFRPANNT